MRASQIQRLTRRILEPGGGFRGPSYDSKVMEKSASVGWSNVAEWTKYGSFPWNQNFGSVAGKGLQVPAGPRGVGNTGNSIVVVPASFQPFLRGYQVRGLASGFRTRNGARVDIGTRARQQQARRLWTIAISGTLVAGFIIVVLNTFQENMMFYITPSQALEKYYIDPSKNKFRLGGLVLEGSVHHFKSTADMEFVVTDLANEILVRYRGALPDLFREGHSVVAEGFLRPIDNYPGRPDSLNDVNEELVERAKKAGCYFAAVDVLAKHDEKYMPKEVAAAIEKNKAAQDGVTPLVPLTTIAEAAPPTQPTKEIVPPTSGPKKGVAQTPGMAQQYEIRI